MDFLLTLAGFNKSADVLFVVYFLGGKGLICLDINASDIPIDIELIDDAQIEAYLNARADRELNWLTPVDEEKESRDIPQ